ncbi:MAG: hypothetical protein RL318_2818 [Fibrobacterota bacterium]|jgi:hypothetical protein
MAQALNGQLKEFPLTDVLQFIQQQRKSGRLILSTRTQRAEIGIQRGNIAFVEVDGKNVETQISRWLQTSARITQDELLGLESVSRQMDRSVLETLVAKRFITSEERAEWAHYVAEDLVCDLFAWQDGSHEFNTELPATTPRNIPLNLSTEMISMEGMRRTDEWPRLLQRFPTPDVAVSRGNLSLEEIEPGPERMILDAIPEEGQITLIDLEKRVPFTRYRIYEVLAAYGDQGFARFHVEGQTLGAIPVAMVPQKTISASSSAMMAALAIAAVLLAMGVNLVLSQILSSFTVNSTNAATQAKARFESQKLHSAVLAHRAKTGEWPRSLGALRWDFSRSELELIRGLDYKLKIPENGFPIISIETDIRSKKP